METVGTSGDATSAPRLRADCEHVSPMRRHIPNALTILRFAAIPVFVWLLLAAGDGAAWGAGVFFAAAALTDQLDGFLARRWHVESAFGKVADPLADRLMIDVAAVLLFVGDRLPLVPMIVIVARDLVLVLGYKLVVPRGYTFEVSFLGKAATWVLYAALCFLIVTPQGTDWPVVLVWIGVVLAVVAALEYVARARREVARSP
jgi:CDP-diacylglycerol--glycerol-3-phosphate 3-phosphatidyltransferase